MAITRNLGPSANQSFTYDAVGIAEDMSPIITRIDPETNLFMTTLSTDEDAKDLEFGWMTEGLRPPGVNAHLEKIDYESAPVGSIEGKTNNVQHFVNSGFVTDAMRKVKKIYNEQDELARQAVRAMEGQAKDMEYMIVNNAIKRAGTGTVAALSGGIPYFMQVETQSVTITTSSGEIATTDPHGFSTGDFVYFKAATLPTGVDGKLAYYVRVLTDTTFTIFDTQQGAVENIEATQVKPSTAGTTVSVMKSNIVDLGGSADFTVEDLQLAMQMAYNRGGNPMMAYMSGNKKQRFSTIVNALATTNRKPSDKKMETIADVFTCDFGTITANSHRMYPDNRIDILDMSYWDLKWFDRTHRVQGLPKKGSYEEFVIEGWLGLKGAQPKASAAIVNIKRK